MHITSFASGSGGNCAVVSSNGTHILIDAGISLRRLRNGLASLGLEPDDIYAILISHEHGDHISGLGAITKRHGIPILAPPRTADYLRRQFAVTEDFTGHLRFGEDFKLGTLNVLAFKTPHDTPQSAGFRIWDESVSFGYCTDLGRVTDEVFENLKGSDGVMLESNHDLDMLRNGRYPSYLKKRILSDWGHLSNDSCARTAVRLAASGTTSMTLAHLSDENNRPEVALDTVAAQLRAAGFDGITLSAAPPDTPLRMMLTLQDMPLEGSICSRDAPPEVESCSA